jgi:hypothetical protein
MIKKGNQCHCQRLHIHAAKFAHPLTMAGFFCHSLTLHGSVQLSPFPKLTVTRH